MTSTSIYQDLPLSYVYRLDHPTTGEFYIGFRSANKLPAIQDLGFKYFTSSKYVKPRFHEFNYTIIQEFLDPNEAYDLEQFLIYQERKNPSMLNRICRYDGSRFTTSNKPHSEETKIKMRKPKKSKDPNTSKFKHTEESIAKMSKSSTGKKHTDATKIKLSKLALGRVHLKFFTIIETRKTYDKQGLSRYFPEFKQYY